MQLQGHQIVDFGAGQVAPLVQRKGDVFKNRQGAEQGTLLKKHSPALAQGNLFAQIERLRIFAKNGHLPFGDGDEAHHGAQQRGFAGTAATNDGEYLAATYGQIKVPLNPMGSEPGGDIGQDDGVGAGYQLLIPVLEKTRARMASMRITRVMDMTTEFVVSRLRLVVLGFTLRP